LILLRITVYPVDFIRLVMKNLLPASLLLLLFALFNQGFSKSPAPLHQRPRLVVGIIIDQMRWDYQYQDPPGGYKGKAMDEKVK